MKIELNISHEELSSFLKSLEDKEIKPHYILDLLKQYNEYQQWKYFFDEHEELHIEQSKLVSGDFIKFRTGLICVIHENKIYKIGNDYTMNIYYEDYNDIEVFDEFICENFNIIKGIKINIFNNQEFYDKIIRIMNSMFY